MKPRVLIRHENMGFRADYVHTRVCVCMSVYFLVIDSVSHVGHTYMHISQHRARFFFLHAIFVQNYITSTLHSEQEIVITAMRRVSI